MLGTISGPISIPLSLTLDGFDTEPSDGKEQCPDGDSRGGGGTPGTARWTTDYRREYPSPSSEILKPSLKLISQIDDGIPRKVRVPLVPQHRYNFRIPNLAAFSCRHLSLR